MNCKEIITTIIVPLICSLVSGGLTLLGVLITIKSENKKRKEEIRMANKPLFYLIDPFQKYDNKNVSNFEFASKKSKSKGFIEILMKNTDNAILVFDYISINNNKYYPLYGNIVDKNTTFYIYAYIDENTKLNKDSKIIFSIKDTLGNKYQYKLGFKDKDSKYLTTFEEIT